MDSEFWSMFFQQFLMVMLPVLATAAAGALVALVKKWWAEAKAMYPTEMEQLEWAAGVAVKAAEQAGAAGLIDEKKAYAMQVVEEWLSSKGLKLDVVLIEAAVEAAVLEKVNKGV